MSAPIVVLKLGSSVLRTPADLPGAVQVIYRHWREGERVVAVVSALGATTDELLARARSLADEPEPAHLAALLATGERVAVELLALALQRAGIPFHALAPERSGLRVAGHALDAEPVALDVAALLRRLEQRPVLVLPGFVGLDEDGEIALLGRGGSDLTALFVARELRAARCLLLKDVDGLYERDPAAPGPRPRRFEELPFARAAELDGGIVQPKAVAFAAAHGFAFEVGALDGATATRVGAPAVRFRATPPREKLRVVLAGLGSVGRGVFAELARQPERFELAGVASRSFERARALGVPRELWCSAPAELLEREPDALVELTGAPEALPWMRAALERGIDVVTAHKECLASSRGALEAAAESSGARLSFSAAVGGALPAIETVRRVARRGPIRALDGVLNATTNLVLALGEQGTSLEDALAEARARGLAESDVRRDLDGSDAAAKLALLAREAFGVDLDPRGVPRVVLDAALLRLARRARAGGERLRIVARARRTEAGGFAAELAAVKLPAGHALAAEGLENRLLVTSEDGASELAIAAGAGRWPTTLAVMADLHDLARAPRERSSPVLQQVRA